MQEFNKEKYLKEYIELGITTNLFESSDIDYIKSKVTAYEIINNPNSSYITNLKRKKNGSLYLEINYNKICEQGNLYADQIIFKELSHAIIDTYTTIQNIDHQKKNTPLKRFMQYANEKSTMEDEDQGSYIYGFNMLEKILSQNISDILVSEKYHKPLTMDKKPYIMCPNKPSATFFSYNPVRLTLIKKFANLLYNDTSTTHFYKQSFKPNFLDNIINQYEENIDTIDSLYTIFKYFGIIDYSIVSQNAKISELMPKKADLDNAYDSYLLVNSIIEEESKKSRKKI